MPGGDQAGFGMWPDRTLCNVGAPMLEKKFCISFAGCHVQRNRLCLGLLIMHDIARGAREWPQKAPFTPCRFGQYD
jgi:hypothetical protein